MLTAREQALPCSSEQRLRDKEETKKMRARQELKLDVDSKKKIAAATFPLLCVLEGLTL